MYILPLLCICVLSAAEWQDATGDLGGDYGWGEVSVSTIAAAPGTDRIYTWIRKVGLYVSTDGGKRWRETLKDATEAPSDGIPNLILFDPRDPQRLWIALMYGKGLLTSGDGGATMSQIGAFDHLDGVTIDFADPERKGMVFAKHEQSRSLVRSRDGGKSWRGIGMNLPEDTRFTSWPLLLGDGVLLTNTSGWGGGKIAGIWRSEDWGEEWSKVSEASPTGFALRTVAGSVLWPIHGGRLARSADGGRTWTPIDGSPATTPMQLPDGRLAGLRGRQLALSADDGLTWKDHGAPLVGNPSAIGPNLCYAPGRKEFFAAAPLGKQERAVWRLAAE